MGFFLIAYLFGGMARLAGILVLKGIEPVLPTRCKHRALTTGLPGNSPDYVLNVPFGKHTRERGKGGEETETER